MNKQEIKNYVLSNPDIARLIQEDKIYAVYIGGSTSLNIELNSDIDIGVVYHPDFTMPDIIIKDLKIFNETSIHLLKFRFVNIDNINLGDFNPIYYFIIAAKFDAANIIYKKENLNFDFENNYNKIFKGIFNFYLKSFDLQNNELIQFKNNDSLYWLLVLYYLKDKPLLSADETIIVNEYDSIATDFKNSVFLNNEKFLLIFKNIYNFYKTL